MATAVVIMDPLSVTCDMQLPHLLLVIRWDALQDLLYTDDTDIIV